METVSKYSFEIGARKNFLFRKKTWTWLIEQFLKYNIVIANDVKKLRKKMTSKHKHVFSAPEGKSTEFLLFFFCDISPQQFNDFFIASKWTQAFFVFPKKNSYVFSGNKTEPTEVNFRTANKVFMFLFFSDFYDMKIIFFTHVKLFCKDGNSIP